MTPKPDGTKRPLGILTVLDRVIQQAIAQILTPIYEPVFSDHSYGFRPARSAHDAIRAVQRESKERRRKWVVDCDLKAFFDTVNHDVLMSRLTYAEARELDGWLRRRLRLYCWKQWGRLRTRRRILFKLGINRATVHMASRSRKGPWRMSQNSKVRGGMKNECLDQQGVPSIENQWINILYPNGPAKDRSRVP